MANNVSFLAASGLTFLTERQKTAYLLHAENMTYNCIGEEMGITASTAREHVRAAERRIREYVRYQKRLERDKQRIELILTRGNLWEIREGLQLLKCELSRQTRKTYKTDWMRKEELRFRYRMVSELAEKINAVLNEMPMPYVIPEEGEKAQQCHQVPTELRDKDNPKKNGDSE